MFASYRRRFLVSLLLLTLSVPWLATLWLDSTLWGLPVWLIYSIAGTLVFTILTAVLLQAAWNHD